MVACTNPEGSENFSFVRSVVPIRSRRRLASLRDYASNERAYRMSALNRRYIR
jgi:hypothetical protein